MSPCRAQCCIAERDGFAQAWTTDALRVHAIESAWMARVHSATIYCYDLPAAGFEAWPDASGQWFAEHDVEPVDVLPLTDLLGLHAVAGIELRVVPSLWRVHDLAVSNRWEFSIVRMRNAQPRQA